MTRSATLSLEPVVSLIPFVGNGELIAFNVGPDGAAYLVTALGPLDYRTERRGASFAKTVPDKSQSYRVVGLSAAQSVLDLIIEHERFNIHDIQPLINELLLICGRSHFKGPNDFEKNGRVYTREGRFVREILLGDGIQTIQATQTGVIWTSFFDEGIFGNYGWTVPIGAAGLVAWDVNGDKLYDFEPDGGLESICDCYALNVASQDDVWLYYYTEFPLVHLHRQQIKSFWMIPVEGSDAFAVSRDTALFRGGYDDHDTYHLFSIDRGGEAELTGTVELRDPQGGKIIADRVVGRGNAIYLISSYSLYRIDVPTAVAALHTSP